MNECLALADLGASINLMPLSIWKELSLPALTKTRMILELADRTISTQPASPRMFSTKKTFLRTARALIDVHGEQMTLRHDDQSVTFKVVTPKLSPTISLKRLTESMLLTLLVKSMFQKYLNFLKVGNPLLLRIYEFDFSLSISQSPSEEVIFLCTRFGGDDKLPVIIAKNLKDEDKTALIKVLKSHKRAIAWKISDIKGINPQFCTHKILMEENAKPVVQHQRRVNPKIHEVIKQEVIKLLDAGLIYPISDSPWMLERLAGNEYYCFLDGFSGYFQIPIDPLDQEKTTFTCPYGTFAYRRMPFGLCNAPGTFQRCMVAIFHDMIEKPWKSSWMISRFLVTLSLLEGIVLGHKISKSGIEVDKAKVDVIAKLPHPTTDFSKIARPMTHLLEKETPLRFSKECIEALKPLRMKGSPPATMLSKFAPEILLHQEFDVEIRDIKEQKISPQTNLSRLKIPNAK
ncbi:reverse transcriptase domain-containing protein [Tanacetum coccineum]